MTLPSKYADRSTLKVPEMAELMGCDEKIITAAIDEGKLIAVNIGRAAKKAWRSDVGDFIRWKLSRRNVRG